MESQNNFFPPEDDMSQGHAQSDSLPWQDEGCGCARENACCADTREGRCHRTSQPLPADALYGFSLAMVYSPYQIFQNVYEPQEGLSRGTIFAELDKPFSADGRCR